MTPEEKVEVLKEAGVWDVIGFPGCIDKLIALVAANEREKLEEQEPFDMDDHQPHRLCECRKCMEYFTPLPDCDAFAASGKPIAEQEPVGEMIDKAGYKGAAWYLEPPATGTKLYAAPIRTKDLTDDEISVVFKEAIVMKPVGWMGFARAVIAADREKNK